MVTVTRFAEAVLPHGTTTVFIDNHEIANVFGLEGIRWMVDEGAALPLKVFLAIPSCVPALPGFEDAGAVVGPDEVREALGWPEVGGLGELMNMPGVIGSDETVHELIAATLEAGQPVTGHWSLAGWNDHRLHAYAASGVDSDHESVRKEDALAKLRAGMWVQFREGSAWHDVATLVPLLTEDGVDSAPCAARAPTTSIPETLVTVGHMNHVVRTAIDAGLDPLVAIQLATVNAAEYFGRRHDLGSIAPGPLRGHPLRRGPARAPAAPRARRRRAGAASGSRRSTIPRARETRSGSGPGPPRTISASRRPARPPGADDRDGAGVLATEHRVVEAPVADGEVPRLDRARSRQGRLDRAPRRPRDDRARLRPGPRARARRRRDDGRARQPQPARRRDERRGDAASRSSGCGPPAAA